MVCLAQHIHLPGTRIEETRMSLDRALKALAGTAADRVARMEFMTHPEYFRRITEIDPYEHTMDAWLKALEILAFDPRNHDSSSAQEKGRSIFSKLRGNAEVFWFHNALCSRTLPADTSLYAVLLRLAGLSRDRGFGTGQVRVSLRSVTARVRGAKMVHDSRLRPVRSMAFSA